MKKGPTIFSISGNPVSGKSTVINKLIEILKNRGILEENLHVVSTGKIYREHFNKIVNLIKSIDDENQLSEISKDEDIKKLLANPEHRQKIQDTIVQFKKLGLNIDDFDISSLNSAEELANIRYVLDEVVDPYVADLGKKILEENNPNDVWLFDSRLAFHNIPESFSVRLIVKDNVAAERLINDKTRGKEDTGYADIGDARKKVIERTEAEQDRYKQRYGIDLLDTDNYNLIIDTSYADAEEVADTIIKCEKCNREEKPYGKMWASPEKFLPLQGVMQTGGIGFGSGLDFNQIRDLIKINGYDPSKEIEVIEVDGKFYIIEGHHRNFALANLGKTLIPYKKCQYLTEEQAKERAKTVKLSDLYDHEGIFNRKTQDGKRRTFYYTDVYPNIYKEIREQQEKNEHDEQDY